MQWLLRRPWSPHPLAMCVGAIPGRTSFNYGYCQKIRRTRNSNIDEQTDVARSVQRVRISLPRNLAMILSVEQLESIFLPSKCNSSFTSLIYKQHEKGLHRALSEFKFPHFNIHPEQMHSTLLIKAAYFDCAKNVLIKGKKYCEKLTVALERRRQYQFHRAKFVLEESKKIESS